MLSNCAWLAGSRRRQRLMIIATAVSALASIVAHAQESCLDRCGNVYKWTGEFTAEANGQGSNIPLGAGNTGAYQAQSSFTGNINVSAPPPLGAPTIYKGTSTDAIGLYNLQDTVTTPDPFFSATVTGHPDLSIVVNGVPTVTNSAQLRLDADCTYTFISDPAFPALYVETDSDGGRFTFHAPAALMGLSLIKQIPLPQDKVLLEADAQGDEGVQFAAKGFFASIPVHTHWKFYPGCKVQLPQVFRQWSIVDGAQHWGGEIYDHYSTHTIAERGCALTSLAMALRFAGVTTTPPGKALDPGTLNDFLKDPQAMCKVVTDLLEGRGFGGTDICSGTTGYSGPNLKFDVATRYVSRFGRLKFQYLTAGSRESADDVLDRELCNSDPHPVIVGVKDSDISPGSFVPGHYVVVTGRQQKSDGSPQYLIEDPATPDRRTLDDYGNSFKLRGAVKDPASDISALDLAIDQNASLLISDAARHRTGLDSATGSIVQQIPGSASMVDSISDDSGEVSPAQSPDAHIVQLFQPVNGTFVVTVNGLQRGLYSLDIDAFSSDGSPQPGIVLHGTTWPGASSTYRVSFVKTPLSRPTVRAVPGDRNGDGVVNCADLAVVKAAFGRRLGQSEYDPRADVNGDGVVNIVDLSTVARALPAGTVCR
jgi:Dockerin type I domain